MIKTKLVRNFGENIRNLREDSKLTLREVANILDIDPSLLAKIERNERYPSKKIVKNIAGFFNIDEKYLQKELLSDQIAYKILDEEIDLDILKVAEEKVSYLKTKRNG